MQIYQDVQQSIKIQPVLYTAESSVNQLMLIIVELIGHS